MRRLLSIASALSLSLATAGAAAAEQGVLWIPRAQGSRVGVEFDIWSTLETHALTWDFIGQIQIRRAAHIDIDIPVAWWQRPAYGGIREATAIWGNPTVGAHWANALNDRIALSAGGALAVSTLLFQGGGVHDDSTDPNRFTRRAIAKNRAFADLHRIAPYHIFLRARVGLELRLLPVLFYRVDLAPILALPLADASEDVELIVDVSNEIEARASFALDEELGFGFERGKVTTIRLALGGKW